MNQIPSFNMSGGLPSRYAMTQNPNFGSFGQGGFPWQRRFQPRQPMQPPWNFVTPKQPKQPDIVIDDPGWPGSPFNRDGSRKPWFPPAPGGGGTQFPYQSGSQNMPSFNYPAFGSL